MYCIPTPARHSPANIREKEKVYGHFCGRLGRRLTSYLQSLNILPFDWKTSLQSIWALLITRLMELNLDVYAKSFYMTFWGAKRRRISDFAEKLTKKRDSSLRSEWHKINLHTDPKLFWVIWIILASKTLFHRMPARTICLARIPPIHSLNAGVCLWSSRLWSIVQ